LGELYPRFRNPDQQQAGTQGQQNGHPLMAKPAAPAGAEAPAVKISGTARNIAAMLSKEHAAEDEEVAAGRRLAKRFVRRPNEGEACIASHGSVAPYLAAGAFVLLAAGGVAAYFLSTESSGTGKPDGSAYVAASFTAPFDAGSATRQAQTVAGWAPLTVGTGAAQGSASNNWAETVQAFKLLAGPEPSAPQEKVNEPQLEQLAASYSGGGAR
jgi:hypothetical protein